MAKFTIDKLAKEVAEKALDEIIYEGKTIREWADIIANQQPCEDCIRELIREFDDKHPAVFADYMQEFNNHTISEIVDYMWDMHDLIEDIKYRLPNESEDEE